MTSEGPIFPIDLNLSVYLKLNPEIVNLDKITFYVRLNQSPFITQKEHALIFMLVCDLYAKALEILHSILHSVINFM